MSGDRDPCLCGEGSTVEDFSRVPAVSSVKVYESMLFLVSRPLVTRAGVRVPPVLTYVPFQSWFRRAVEGTGGTGGGANYVETC